MVSSFLRRARLVGLLGIAVVSLRAAGPYLGKFDSVAALPPPPALGTAEDKYDRDSAYAIYSTRTDADGARAKAEHDYDVFVFAPILGPDFTPAHYPKLAAFFKDTIKEVKAGTDSVKVKWNRPRPYVLEPVRFSKNADAESSASYPSGHSTRGTVMALLLSEIYPQHRAELLAKGELIGWTRIQAGVHTPFDVYAGRFLGRSMVAVLMRNPAFRADLDAVKAEVAAQPALHP